MGECILNGLEKFQYRELAEIKTILALFVFHAGFFIYGCFRLLGNTGLQLLGKKMIYT